MTHKILDKYNELKRERPNLDHELVMTFIEDMSDEASILFDKLLFGCHIYNEEMGKKAISYIKDNNGMQRPQMWSYDDVMKIAKNYVNIENEDFYEWDLVVWANVKYYDYANIETEPSKIIRISIADLTDKDYPFSPPDERAYHWYMEHKEKKEG